MSYTEEQIRGAYDTANVPFMQSSGIRLSADELLWQLGRARGTDVHPVWADSDTVTVKELREAGSRVPVSNPDPLAAILKDIAEHREPEYPPGTTWLDSGKPAIPWYRTGSGMWMKFGQEGTFSHNTPVRPLKRMDVIQ